jgi:hypothetical protein
MAISSEEADELGAVNITTTSLEDGTVGESYSDTVSASGGSEEYTWSKSSGNLPAGLSLNSSSGVISGTPTSSGDFTFTIKVVDENDSSLYDTQSFTVTIDAADTVNITTTTLEDGKVGTAYSKTLSASGGSGSYSWSKSSGTLPPGITLSSGKLSGTPTTAGEYEFTIKVTSGSVSDTATYTITIQPKITETALNTSGFSSGVTVKVDQDGYAVNNYKITTTDGKLTLSISDNNRLLGSNGKPLTALTSSPLSTPPSIPAGKTLVAAYNLGPDGATFSSILTLTFKYDPAGLPAGVDENTLYLAYYDGSLWQNLNGSVNTENNTVTGQISHFSTYAILGQIASTPTQTATPTSSATPTVQPTKTPVPTSTQPADNGKVSPAITIWLIILTVVLVLVVGLLLLVIRKLRDLVS